ncbi:MAG: class I SAM-dependent methyltransferase, partial [bacterium]
MSLKIHGDNRLYWQYQYRIAEEYLIPLWGHWGINIAGLKVLEIGPGEGGILACLADAGAICQGLEYSASRAQIGAELTARNVQFMVGDICRREEYKRLSGPYDFIVFRDVLEHLENKPAALENICALMNHTSRLFLETCPWHMPFGGHQQVMKSWMGKIPYIHLLPSELCLKMARSFGESEELIAELQAVQRCRNTTGQVYQLLRRYDLQIVKQCSYLINPSYKIRFGLPVVSAGVFGS